MREDEGVGVYVHWPFCVSKCAYCDFNSYSNLNWLIGVYQEAVRTELDVLFCSRRFVIETLYLGGGTPTIVPSGTLTRLLRFLFSHAESNVETTIEANPGTVTLESLRLLKESGANRISLGVQSMNDAELAMLRRIHDRRTVLNSVRLVRDSGFENLNVDLIFGLPGQTCESWLSTLEQVLSFKPEHISLYALTVEPGTELYRWIRSGKMDDVNEDLAAEMYDLSEEYLAQAGYEHYEISNWALPNKRCQHNLIYWHNRPYFGVGAGAWSYWKNSRWSNIKDPQKYVTNSLCGGSLVEESEFTSRNREISETLILGLRLLEGISRSDFRQRFDIGLDDLYDQEIGTLVQTGLLEDTGERIYLTKRGRLLGNEVFVHFC